MKRRTKTSPSLRVQQKLQTWQIVVGFSTLIVAVGIGVFFYLNLGNSAEAYAANVTFSSKNNFRGDYKDSSSWQGGEVPGPYFSQSTNINVRGFLVHSGDITLQSNHVVFAVKDTLIIRGNLTLQSIASTAIEPNGVLIVKGNLEIKNGHTLTNRGRLVVTESTINFNSTFENTGTFYAYSPVDYRNANPDEKNKGIAGDEISLKKNDSDLHYLVDNEEPRLAISSITLSYFQAKIEEKKAIIEWGTDQEIANDFFTVERTLDGQTFEAVGTVPGTGNSQSPRTYSFVDAFPAIDTSYYRLRQTSLNGDTEAFDQVAVSYERDSSMTGEITINTVAPNPFSRSFFVDFHLDNPGPVDVQLFDTDGTLVFSEKIVRKAGSNRYEYNAHQNIAPGNYVLQLVQTTATPATFRMVKR